METSMLVLRLVFSFFLIYTGMVHIVKPKNFKHFIPDFLPKLSVNYIFGFIEVMLGTCLMWSETRSEAAIGVFILMILFLPIHIWDVTKSRPAIGSKRLAIIRIPVQFLLMYLSYLIYIH